MNKFTYINQNLPRIKIEIKSGLISTSILRRYAIYSRYDYYRKLGNPNCLAQSLTSENLRICERYVRKIIKNMETEI